MFPNRQLIRNSKNYSSESASNKVRFVESDGSNLRINIPNLIESGRYNIEIYNTNKSPLPVSMSISSFSRSDKVYPIEMHSYVIQPKTKKELYVFSEINKGQRPILNAYVWCEIYRPAGSGRVERQIIMIIDRRSIFVVKLDQFPSKGFLVVAL